MWSPVDAGSRALPAQPVVMAWETVGETPIPPMRCVSLPFTAPALTAMRVRAPQSGGLEMLLSNPAGGRGIYVAGWATLRAFAAPSLHDILLAGRISSESLRLSPYPLRDASGEPRAGSLTPASVRSAAIAVAAEGHAGRRAAHAAQRAQQAEQLGMRRLRAHLLLELARAIGLPGSRSSMNDPWTAQPDDKIGWLAEAPHLLASRIEPVDGSRPQARASAWLPSELDEAVAQIAALAWPLGIGPAAARSRLPRVLRLLSASGHGSVAPEARPERSSINLDAVIATRIAQAGTSLNRARALFDDPIALLASWRADSSAVLQTLEQPDWLLDGWDRLCLLPGDPAEVGALAQMLLYEEERRIGVKAADPEWALPPGLSGAVAAIGRLARNETMRLHELQLHDPDLPIDDRVGGPLAGPSRTHHAARIDA